MLERIAATLMRRYVDEEGFVITQAASTERYYYIDAVL